MGAFRQSFSLSNSETDNDDVDAVVSSGVCVRSVVSLVLLVPAWSAILTFLEHLIEHVAACARTHGSLMPSRMFSCPDTRMPGYKPKFFTHYAHSMLNAGIDQLFPKLCQHILPRPSED